MFHFIFVFNNKRLSLILSFVAIFSFCSSSFAVSNKDIGKGVARFFTGGLLGIANGIIIDKVQKQPTYSNDTDWTQYYLSQLPKDDSDKAEQNIHLSDVVGQDEAVAEVKDILDFFKNENKFTDLGANMPKGILLEGPPGTGKTLIAKALANEAGCNFYYKSASEFVQMYVGMGASRVRELFNKAKENKPAIIFIDEIDAIGAISRTATGGGSDEYRQTLNELLCQMDGFASEAGVFILAATNNAISLDPALKRPGRFTRIVKFDLPTPQGRFDILKHYVNKLPKSDIDTEILKSIALQSTGFSGADLQSLVNEAAIYAAKQNSDQVLDEHLKFALNKIIKMKNS